jgi:hypothetical protein
MVKKIVYSTYVYAISSNCPNFFYVCSLCTVYYGGRILGRNSDKSLKSFPP